jgi:hypothetical protein
MMSEKAVSDVPEGVDITQWKYEVLGSARKLQRMEGMRS